MISNSKIQVDYTTKTRNFQLVFPINFEINIPVDDSVRLLSNVLEEIDYTELYRAYSRKEKNNAASPKNLFKVIVYAYMNNIYSSRPIETACKRDINFMYLLEGAKAPDHNTIARFRSERLKDIIDNLFNQVVLLLKDYGAFGVLKEDMRFRRFLTRGTNNVRTEILILCLAYNIQKLHNKTIANRQGQFLHEIKAA